MHPSEVIDLNADVGESFGAWRIGCDEELIPLVTSINVACGAHAGDPATIERTIRLGIEAGVRIGAHPGYPDLAGFGRRDLAMRPGDLEASVVYQVAAVAGIARSLGTEIGHVKPHGALYNAAARDPAIAERVARAVARCSRDLVLVAPPASALLAAGLVLDLAVVAEGFVDRAYEPDGSLRARMLPDAVHHDPAIAAGQAVSIARDGCVTAVDGSEVALPARTLCIHGDEPRAPDVARAVRAALTEAGIAVAPFAARD